MSLLEILEDMLDEEETLDEEELREISEELIFVDGFFVLYPLTDYH